MQLKISEDVQSSQLFEGRSVFQMFSPCPVWSNLGEASIASMFWPPCCTNDSEKVEMGSRSMPAVLSARLVEELSTSVN